MKEWIKRKALQMYAPDYECIKAQNEELKDDIYKLVRRGDKPDGTYVRLKWEIEYRIDEAMWIGEKS